MPWGPGLNSRAIRLLYVTIVLGDHFQELSESCTIQPKFYGKWINERLSGIEYSKAKKEDLEYDDIMASDSDDENYQIQFYDAAIRKTQSKLLKRIKREIVNSAM